MPPQRLEPATRRAIVVASAPGLNPDPAARQLAEWLGGVAVPADLRVLYPDPEQLPPGLRPEAWGGPGADIDLIRQRDVYRDGLTTFLSRATRFSTVVLAGAIQTRG